MAISITLYRINKRRNSTKQPTNAEVYKAVSGNFVEESSMFTPNIIISRDEVTHIAAFNYFSINWPNDVVTTRYYWITNKTIMPNGCIRILGTEDCFSTFRANILASDLYLVKSSVVLPEESRIIAHPDLPRVPKPNIKVYPVSNTGVFDQDDGIYLVGIIAQEVTGESEPDNRRPADNAIFRRGSVGYYGFTKESIKLLIDQLRLQEGADADFKVGDIIVSMMFIPISLATFGLNWSSDVKTYFFLKSGTSVGAVLKILNMPYIEGDLSYLQKYGVLARMWTVTVSAQSWYPLTDTSCFSYEPYFYAKLQTGLIGTLPIDLYKCKYIINDNDRPTFEIKISIEIDLASGYARLYHVYPSAIGTGISNDIIVSSMDSTIGVLLNFSTLYSDSYVERIAADNMIYNNVLRSSLAVGGAALKLDVKGGLSNTVEGVVNLTESIENREINKLINSSYQISSKGSNGVYLGYIACMQPMIITEEYPPINGLGSLDNLLDPRYVYTIFDMSVFPTSKYAIIVCNNAALIKYGRYSDGSLNWHIVTDMSNGMTFEEQTKVCTQLNIGMFIE